MRRAAKLRRQPPACVKGCSALLRFCLGVGGRLERATMESSTSLLCARVVFVLRLKESVKDMYYVRYLDFWKGC